MEKDKIEEYLEEFTGLVYKKFKQDCKKQSNDIFRIFVVNRSTDKTFNPYCFYGMKVLDIMDKEFLKYNFFDQDEKFVLPKTSHKDGNEYMSINEIFAVINEVKIKPKNIKMLKQVCTRVKVLSILNIWSHTVDSDTSIDQEVSDRYFDECKLYFKETKKYMRYARLLKCALEEARYYETPDCLPNNETEYRNFLVSPFVYVMLEPHNHMEDSEFDHINITRSIPVDGELITF